MTRSALFACQRGNLERGRLLFGIAEKVCVPKSLPLTPFKEMLDPPVVPLLSPSCGLEVWYFVSGRFFEGARVTFGLPTMSNVSAHGPFALGSSRGLNYGPRIVQASNGGMHRVADKWKSTLTQFARFVSHVEPNKGTNAIMHKKISTKQCRYSPFVVVKLRRVRRLHPSSLRFASLCSWSRGPTSRCP